MAAGRKHLIHGTVVTVLCSMALCSCASSVDPGPEEPLVEDQLKEMTAPGAYDMSGTSVRPIVAYSEGRNQHSYYSASGIDYCGVTDMDAGAAFRVGVTSGLEEGDKCIVRTVCAGTSKIPSSGEGKGTCIKVSSDRCWIVDADHKIGYIVVVK